MPKVTFKDFMHERFVSKHLWNNPDAKRIFDILNEDANIKKEPLNCQLVGRMQRLILAAEGYKSAANKPMDTLYFRSAMTYKKS